MSKFKLRTVSYYQFYLKKPLHAIYSAVTSKKKPTAEVVSTDIALASNEIEVDEYGYDAKFLKLPKKPPSFAGYESYLDTASSSESQDNNLQQQKPEYVEPQVDKKAPDEKEATVEAKADEAPKDNQHIVHLKTSFLNPFKVFLDMKKDMVDTLKPYKGYYQAQEEAMELAYGIANLLYGLFCLVAAPITLPIYIVLQIPLFFYTLWNESFSFALKDMFKNIGSSILFTLSSILEGTLLSLRGATQIAATPLTFVKILFRFAITGVLGFQKIEENAGIQKLVEEQQIFGSSSVKIAQAIHAKVEKAWSKGQLPHDSAVLWETFDTAPEAVAYIQLFAPKPPEKDDSLTKAQVNSTLYK